MFPKMLNTDTIPDYLYLTLTLQTFVKCSLQQAIKHNGDQSWYLFVNA